MRNPTLEERMRKRSATALLVFAALVSGCGATVGSGTLVSEEHELEPFDRLVVSHAFEVQVSFGDTPGITITVDDNLIDRVNVRVSDGALHVGVKRTSSIRRATLQATVILAQPLAELRASGAANVSVDGVLTGPSLEVRSAGASVVDLQTEVDALEMHASGASTITARGRATSALLDASGASALELEELTLTSARASLSGASKANIEVSEELVAALSGSSSLTYGGDPSRLEPTLSGASKLRAR
jgi:hypothetical protein